MFKSKKELAQALIEGRRFKIKNNPDRVIYYDEKANYMPFRCGTDELYGHWNHYGSLEEIKEWYEDLPENGVLCWVSDEAEDETRNVAIVIGRNKNKYYYETINGVEWCYAKPMTAEEVKKHVLSDSP